MRHIAARAVPRVGQHAVSQELFRRRDSDEAPPPATIESEFAQNLVARAEYRSWRQGDAYASPVPNGGKKLGTDDLLRQLLDGSSPLQDEDGLTGCLSGYLNGLAPREVQQAPATRLQDEFKLQEVLGVGGFGVVRAATSKLDGRRCAIKAVPLPSRLEREAALGEVSRRGESTPFGLSAYSHARTHTLSPPPGLARHRASTSALLGPGAHHGAAAAPPLPRALHGLLGRAGPTARVRRPVQPRGRPPLLVRRGQHEHRQQQQQRRRRRRRRRAGDQVATRHPLCSDGAVRAASSSPMLAAMLAHATRDAHATHTPTHQPTRCAAPTLAEILARESATPPPPAAAAITPAAAIAAAIAPTAAPAPAPQHVRWGWMAAAAGGLHAMHEAGFAHHGALTLTLALTLMPTLTLDPDPNPEPQP